MNVPAQTVTNGTASTVVSAAPCVACVLTITNTSAANRVYAIIDATAAAALPTAPGLPPSGMIVSSGTIAASGVFRLSPIGETLGVPFAKGLVIQSFALDLTNSPIWTALSAADANVLAWTAPLV